MAGDWTLVCFFLDVKPSNFVDTYQHLKQFVSIMTVGDAVLPKRWYQPTKLHGVTVY
jgi:hypothetical protein